MRNEPVRQPWIWAKTRPESSMFLKESGPKFLTSPTVPWKYGPHQNLQLLRIGMANDGKDPMGTRSPMPEMLFHRQGRRHRPEDHGHWCHDMPALRGFRAN